MSGLEVLDPTGERQPRERRRLPRPDSIDGRRVALLDISKARGNVFLDRLEQLLSERGAKTERFRKPTFARPAPSVSRLRLLYVVQCARHDELRG